MEGFPTPYVEHNLPLVVVSGLGEQHSEATKPSEPALRDNGTRISLLSDTCAGECVPALLEQVLQFDGSDSQWNPSSLPGPAGRMKYKIKTIGRTYALPPRKAAPLAQPTSSEFSSSPPRSTELHSPLSPLSPGSPVYPDGVFTPIWFAKHQHHVPALIISFFDLTAPSPSNQDDQIKADINAIRAALTRSGYRTKFAAVLTSNRSILQEPAIEDRIASIRRSTGLDSKLGLFFMPPMSSQAEISTFVETMMKTLQPQVVEFSRDLTKHARRKKARVGPTPAPSSPTGNPSQALSVSGWNVRYEIKQGVFAEFRQEMDVAERHYIAAIDELFGDEGVLESMPTWSPRWNEARLLSDCLALRVVRSQLWNTGTTSAAQFWNKYRLRIKSIVDRRGKGSHTYSWAACQARYCEIMAQLIIRAGIPSFQQPQRHSEDADASDSWQVYALSEKTVGTVDRLPPHCNLHHPGYWFRLAAGNARIRRQRALSIPAEDQSPTSAVPASTVVKRTKSYDLYLALEPHEESPLSATSSHDHTAECTRLTKQAVQQFDDRSQGRMADVLRLDLARDLVAVEDYDGALTILLQLLDKSHLRDEGWDHALREILLLVHQCSQQSKTHPDLLLAAVYELLTLGSPSADEKISLAKAIEDLPPSLTTLNFQDRQRLCPVSISFAFESKDTSVGDTISCQLSCLSCLDASAEPMTLSSVTLSFDNGRSVNIYDDATKQSPHLIPDTDSKEDPLDLKANLTMRPGDSRVFSFTMKFNDARTVRLTEVSLAIKNERFAITHSLQDESLFRSKFFLGPTEAGSMRKDLPGSASTIITVAPKPPKVQLLVHNQKKRYYTDGTVVLEIEIVNGEEETIDGNVSAHGKGEELPGIGLHWTGADADAASNPDQKQPADGSSTKPIPQLKPGASHKATLLMKAPIEPVKTNIEISAEYVLLSDSTTIISKIATVGVEFSTPFEPTSSFGPLLHADTWPNYFDPTHGPSQESPEGIPQLWRLNTQLRSVATEGLHLHGADLKIAKVYGESVARVRSHDDDGKQTFEPRQSREYLFDLYTRKQSIDDRGPTSIESTLEVTWSRDQESTHTVTRLALPRLTLPVSEPRVLCTRNDNPADDGRTTISYHIENPSTHFLTFALTMDASEDFAFSGPKYQSLSLAPLSRFRVLYQVLPQDRGDLKAEEERWIWPNLQVVDSYYQKTLRVLPGGPHVNLDERQNIGVQID